MKTLYVSDLDGTLLRSDETTSDYTNQVINHLVEKGMLFSYATARSYQTARKVTKGLQAKIPLIVYNGTFIKDNITGDIIVANYLDHTITQVIDHFIEHHIYPTVYAYIQDIEKFSFIEEKCSQEMLDFMKTRQGDPRMNPVTSIQQLYDGDIFYLTCIDEKEKLEPFYHQYKDQYHIVYQEDIYTKAQWLEIMPKNVSKAHAIQQLKNLLGCDKVIAFGDGLNDIEMFELADEAYAVENAVDELKKKATQIIGNHNEDGVAKWLIENYEK